MAEAEVRPSVTLYGITFAVGCTRKITNLRLRVEQANFVET